MMHICTVATLCFPEKTVPRNYYYCVQDDNSLCLCFKSMYRTLFVAIFTSTFIFSMSKSSHTYRNINISNQSRSVGDSALLSLQVSQVFKITRELLYHVANMLAPCPSRLFAALAKQNKRFVCSRKHVERRPRGEKKRYPLHKVSRKNYEIFHERAKRKSIFQKSSV